MASRFGFHIRHRRWLVLGSLGATALLILNGDRGQPQSSHTGARASAVSKGIDIRGESTRLIFDTPARMCKASVVADVTVRTLGRSHWNSPEGSRPQNLDSRALLRKGYAILTPVRFSQMNVLADHRGRPTTEFVTLGGIVGQDQFWLHDMPQLRPAARYVVVFVPSFSVQAGTLTDATLGAIDAFPIDAGVLLHGQSVEQGVTQPEVKIRLSELRQMLLAC